MKYSRRSPEAVDALTGDFLRRNEFYHDPARLTSAVLTQHRGGGNWLMEGWLADSYFAHGSPHSALHNWLGVGINMFDFSTTANGGPYADLNGTNEYLRINDNAWNEFGGQQFFTWRWVYLRATTGLPQCVLSKYDGGVNCSWALIFNNANFQFIVNGVGPAANDVTVNSTYAEQYGKWYFLAGWFVPSTVTRIYVGAADDDDLTIDTQAVGVPAVVFNGTSPLSMGAIGAGLGWWMNGLIGVGNSRRHGGPADDYARRLFHNTRWFYQA